MITTEDRRLAAGCLMGSYAGTDVPAWLLDLVRDGLGAVLLFAQNVVDDEGSTADLPEPPAYWEPRQQAGLDIGQPER